MDDIHATEDDYKQFLLEFFKQNYEEIRHRETILNNFLSIFGSFLVVGVVYFITTQSLDSSTSLLFVIFIFLLSLMGYLHSEQVCSQITHLQLCIVSIKTEVGFRDEYKSFTDNDSGFLKITRVNKNSSRFFGLMALTSLLTAFYLLFKVDLSL